jgi:hypothetical protein
MNPAAMYAEGFVDARARSYLKIIVLTDSALANCVHFYRQRLMEDFLYSMPIRQQRTVSTVLNVDPQLTHAYA